MKNRILNEDGGISVEKKKDTDFKLYYFKFHLSDEDYEENSERLSGIEYSEIMGERSTIELNEGDCVCIIEKDECKEVERYEYYYRKRTAKGQLECRMKRAWFWGKNTWKIVFSCDGMSGDRIGSRHFKVNYREKQFAFPKESILVKGKKSRNKREYFIILPDKVDIKDVFVSADDVVQGKYSYNCKRK